MGSVHALRHSAGSTEQICLTKDAQEASLLFCIWKIERGLCSEKHDVEAGANLGEVSANDLAILATDAIAFDGILGDL